MVNAGVHGYSTDQGRFGTSARPGHWAPTVVIAARDLLHNARRYSGSASREWR
jgi:hypothetical protein